MDKKTCDSVMHILKDHFDIDVSLDADMAKNLFGRAINMDEIDLVYLVHILEQEHSFRFSESDFDQPEFYTIGGLVDCVCRHVAC